MRLPIQSRALADYFSAFDLAAVFVGPGGDVRTSRDPAHAGATEAWWTSAADAERVAMVARTTSTLPAAEAIEAAARRLGLHLTPHETAIARAEAALARIDAALAQAQRNGGLKFFNAEFRRRRKVGARMSYSEAMRRLRRALAGVAAGGVTRAVVAEVFDGA
jgi:hypothetical protein